MHYAPMALCTDNAAMIASHGYWYALAHKEISPHELQTDSSLSV
jgi:tRNA A37 threonylcarbamoyltransferase TsaD